VRRRRPENQVIDRASSPSIPEEKGKKTLKNGRESIPSLRAEKQGSDGGPKRPRTTKIVGDEKVLLLSKGKEDRKTLRQGRKLLEKS